LTLRKQSPHFHSSGKTIKAAREAWRINIPTTNPKHAKLRPMRVEMYCIHWNWWLGKNLQRRNCTDVACIVSL